MKKALFSLLLTIACLPMAFSQQPANVHVETTEAVSCGSYNWIDGNAYSSDTIVTLLRNDTVFVLELTVSTLPVDTLEAIQVAGHCYAEWNNKTWNTAGTYIDTIYATAAGQCDSVVKVQITLAGNDSIDLIDDTVCGMYIAPWGDTLTESVNGNDVNVVFNGCTINVGEFYLVVNHASDTAETEVVDEAEGCKMNWHGIEVGKTDSVYYTTLTNAVGCDSVVSIKVLSFSGSSYDTTYRTVCDYYVNGEDTLTADTYITTYDTTGDCPVYRTLALTIDHTYRDTANVVVRDVEGGCSLTWFGNRYDASAIGDTLLAYDRTVAGGCDSLVSIRITRFTGVHHDTTSVRHCGRYIWRHGNVRDTLYTDTEIIDSTVTEGCTSYQHLIVTFYEKYDTVEAGEVCARYRHMFFSRTPAMASYYYANFTETGLHTTDEFGEALYSTDYSTHCVTNHAVNVVIKAPEQRESSINYDTVVCDQFTFVFNRNIYTWDFSADSALRDSVYTKRSCYDIYGHVKVTVNKRDTVRYEVDACDSYTWTGYSNETYTRSTTASMVLPDTLDNNGCRVVGMLDLTINHTPEVTIEGDWNLYQDSTNSTTLTAVSNMPISNYKWYRNGVLQSETSNVLRVNNVNTNIDIRLESESNEGCVATNWITITYNVGIEENEAVEVNIYPNPASRYLNIESAEGLKEVVIYNAIGQQVIVRSLEGTRSTLDLGSLASGNYTMRITAANGEQVTRKFIVNK